MKNRTLFFTLTALGLAFGAVPLTGCSYLRARAARSAYTQYQDALAAGDMTRARTALLTLVRTDEDVPDYWIELGKLQIQLGAYREAYDAFSHAHELDRTNVDVLAMLAQLALVGGDTDVADEHARSLALLAPNNPAVTLVRGYVAYKSGELQKADAAADALLVNSPSDPFAKILKTRVLVAEGRVDDAIALLEDQHRTVPTDVAAIRNLTEIYRSRGDWADIARIQFDNHRLNPKDSAISRTVVEAFLRSGNVAAANTVSRPMLSPSASPQLVEDTLSLWARFAPHGKVLPGAAKLAGAATADRRVSFADYFNRVGDPGAARALLGSSQQPVTRVNARWNAVFAQSLALQGQLREAKSLFDLVLDREPDQSEALRGRSSLEAQNGMTKQAIIDAQRLVTISPGTGEDRLLLAQAYLADGNRNEVRRTLWEAFQELPNDERVYSALKNVLASTGDTDAQRRLDEEAADRRTSKLTKELI